MQTNTMDNFRSIAALVIILLGATIAVVNWTSLFIGIRNKKKGTGRQPSTISFVTIICALVAFMIYPITPKWWIWIIPAADIGNWMILFGLSGAAKGTGANQ